MTSVDLLDWRRLGSELRAVALECDGFVAPAQEAYKFLLENPEYFWYSGWPDGMPADPPLELVKAYLGA